MEWVDRRRAAGRDAGRPPQQPIARGFRVGAGRTDGQGGRGEETRRTDLHTCVLRGATLRVRVHATRDVAHTTVGDRVMRACVRARVCARVRVSTRTCVVRDAFACAAGNQLCASIGGLAARGSIFFSFLPMLGRDRMSRDAG